MAPKSGDARESSSIFQINLDQQEFISCNTWEGVVGFPHGDKNGVQVERAPARLHATVSPLP